MQRCRRSRAGSAITAALATGACAAAVADATPVSTLVGHTATGNDNGGCSLCSAVQFATVGSTPSYAFPYDGVLTTVLVRTGSSLTSGEWVQARSFRLLDATHAKVITEG